jgi:hypothetical protein
MSNKPPHSIRCLLLMLILLPAVATYAQMLSPTSAPKWTTPPGLSDRSILVLRDRTVSFKKQLPETNTEIQKIVAALGPGDELIVVDIGPRFDPRQNVAVQCRMPELSHEMMQPASNLLEWNRKQAQLDETWKVVEWQRKRLLAYFGKKVESWPGGTDLEAVLAYSAKRLNRRPEGKPGYLLIFSDVRTEKGKLKTSLPPARPGAFEQIDVQVFMSPWNSEDWEAVETAWQNWFLNNGRAKSFRMYDTAESLTLNPLPPNGAPRKLPSPFVARGDAEAARHE